MCVDSFKSGFELKEFHKYTDDEMIELELTFGHDFYIAVKTERDFRLRKKKIDRILNNIY